MIRYFMLPDGPGGTMTVELMDLNGDVCRKLEDRFPGYEVDEFATVEVVLPLLTLKKNIPVKIGSDGAEVVEAWVTDEEEARNLRIKSFLNKNKGKQCQHQC